MINTREESSSEEDDDEEDEIYVSVNLQLIISIKHYYNNDVKYILLSLLFIL